MSYKCRNQTVYKTAGEQIYTHIYYVATGTRVSHEDGQIMDCPGVGDWWEVNGYFGGRELRHCNLVKMVHVVLCLVTQV